MSNKAVAVLTREHFKIKSGYTAVFRDNLAITHTKKNQRGKLLAGKKRLFKREFYYNELYLSLFDTMYFTKILEILEGNGRKPRFFSLLLLFAPV